MNRGSDKIEQWQNVASIHLSVDRKDNPGTIRPLLAVLRSNRFTIWLLWPASVHVTCMSRVMKVPQAGQICYGSLLWLPAVASTYVNKAGLWIRIRIRIRIRITNNATVALQFVSKTVRFFPWTSATCLVFHRKITCPICEHPERLPCVVLLKGWRSLP